MAIKTSAIISSLAFIINLQLKIILLWTIETQADGVKRGKYEKQQHLIFIKKDQLFFINNLQWSPFLILKHLLYMYNNYSYICPF